MRWSKIFVSMNKAFAILCTALIFSCSASSAAADTFGIGSNSFDIEFVTIGNPGNPPDTTGRPTPAGSVPYPYRIGKFEVSEQMIDKANALGGLWLRKTTRGPNKPAASVSWNQAARFVNWLNTISGSSPAYKFDIQPGEIGYSSDASIQLWDPEDAGYDPNNLFRNSLARYFLPSTDEWYKAAYYDPTGGVYFDYPTSSDNKPDGIDFVGDPDFDAVFRDGVHNPQPNDVTNVGVLSPYGTAGQGGNVWELEETEFDLVNDSPSAVRGIRGGDWTIEFFWFRSPVRFAHITNDALSGHGFHVASAIPEPSTLLLVALAGLIILCHVNPAARRP